jgi:uncharacterized protein
MHRTSMVVVFLVCAVIAQAQMVEVNKQNKTITVTADEKVTVAAEVALVKIGYHAYGKTKDDAFQETVRNSNTVIDAILKSGVSQEDIQTDALDLSYVSPDADWTPEMKHDRLFEARQSWKIHVPAGAAQSVISSAEAAGANEIEAPEWNVADPSALQAKAGAAALVKARRIAEQMASGLGAHLGELVFASNHAPAPAWLLGALLNTENAEISSRRAVSPPLPLKIFPEKVSAEATVYAVFAIQ